MLRHDGNQPTASLETKSLQRNPTVEDFYGTGIDIWAGFGPVDITEKKGDLGRL